VTSASEIDNYYVESFNGQSRSTLIELSIDVLAPKSKLDSKTRINSAQGILTPLGDGLIPDSMRAWIAPQYLSHGLYFGALAGSFTPV